MKPPAWVNWEQFANLNEEETKRAEQNRQQARAEEQENFLNLTGQLQNEAMGQAGARQFGGLEKIGKFKDVMDARDAALKNQTPMMGAAWEQYLDPNKNAPYKSPWANLDQRLGQITQHAEQTQKGATQREKDRQERDRKEVEKQRADAIAKEEKRRAGIKQVEEDIKFGHTLEDFEKELQDSMQKARAQAAYNQSVGGNPNPYAAEQAAAELIIKYKLNRSDRRLRDMLKGMGLNLEWVDRSSPSGYGRPSYSYDPASNRLTVTPPPTEGKK